MSHAQHKAPPGQIRTTIGAGGRIVIPAEIRHALNVKPGDEVILVLEDSGLRIVTAQEAVRRAQSLVRRYVPAGHSLADDLIATRRSEGALE